MSTQYKDLFAALANPFEPWEVKHRTQANRTLDYITARTAMNRLDMILGPENWWDEYFPNEHSVICKLSIRLPDGTVLTKMDAGGNAGMKDPGDDDKSGISDAFKRACVKFGVGRYLYADGVPDFVKGTINNIPRPESMRDHGQQQSRRSAPSQGERRSPPRTGRALYAWILEQEAIHGKGLLKYINDWGKLEDLPTKMVEWPSEVVAEALQVAIKAIQAKMGDVDPEDADIDRQAMRDVG